jgi:serine/threonine protein kinase
MVKKTKIQGLSKKMSLKQVIPDISANILEEKSTCTLPKVSSLYIEFPSFCSIFRSDKIKFSKGGFGEVFKAVDLRDSKPIAIKRIDKEFSSLQSVETEIMVGSISLSSKIVKTIAWSEDTSYYYIAMEYVEGDNLYNFCNDKLKYFWNNPIIAIRVVLDVLSGLVELHSRGIIHRDLKSKNVMLETNMHGQIQNTKIIDFGLSSTISDLPDEISGSPNYIAPEAVTIETRNERSQKMDIWALGIMIHFMIFNVYPFDFRSVKEYFLHLASLRNGKKKLDLQVLESDANENLRKLYQIMLLCLNVNPGLRPSSEELQERLIAEISQKESSEKETSP